MRGRVRTTTPIGTEQHGPVPMRSALPAGLRSLRSLRSAGNARGTPGRDRVQAFARAPERSAIFPLTLTRSLEGHGGSPSRSISCALRWITGPVPPRRPTPRHYFSPENMVWNPPPRVHAHEPSQGRKIPHVRDLEPAGPRCRGGGDCRLDLGGTRPRGADGVPLRHANVKGICCAKSPLSSRTRNICGGCHELWRGLVDGVARGPWCDGLEHVMFGPLYY